MKRYWSEARERLNVLRQLHSLADWVLFLQIFFFAAAVPALVLLKPERLESLLAAKRTGSKAKPDRVRKISSYVDGVIQVASPLVHRGCLTRTLTLYYFLNRAGLNVTVCFGISQVKGEFLGHCWLEKSGQPFLESKDPRPLFKQIYGFPHAVTAVGDPGYPLNPLRQMNE